MDPYHDGLIHHSPVADPEAEPGRPPVFYRFRQDEKGEEPPTDLQKALPRPSRTIFGIRMMTFVLLAVIVLLIIVGSVGGGVGGALAVQNARNSAASAASNPDSSTTIAAPSTVTVTMTGSGPPIPTQAVSTAPALSCPGNNQTHYTAANGGQFVIGCNADFPFNDLQVFANTTSFNTCIENCAFFNKQNPPISCVGVILGPFENTCWLKSAFRGATTTTSKWAARLQ